MFAALYNDSLVARNSIIKKRKGGERVKITKSKTFTHEICKLINLGLIFCFNYTSIRLFINNRKINNRKELLEISLQLV